MINWFRRKQPETPPDATAAPVVEPLAAPETPAHEAPSVPPEPGVTTAPEPAGLAPAPDALLPTGATAQPAAIAPPEAVSSTPFDDYANAAPAAAPGQTGWRERLSGTSIARNLGGLFRRNPVLDDELLDEIETALISADVGVSATMELVGELRRRMGRREFADATELFRALRAQLVEMLEPVTRPLLIDGTAKPFVIVTIGVNGVGKTTTIGKLARKFRNEQRSLMLAAGDTFRAAAVAQLQAWGERNGVAVVAQGQNADAAAVAFDAYQAARSRGTQILIADTAGRLHTQGGLMDELSKIVRVLGKLDAQVPHEILMVIDGTTGQNAIAQVRAFNAKVPVTGLVVTKLDGTAKGGVVFALAREFGIPIRYAGIGERPDDLRVFDAGTFVDALLPESLSA